METTSSAEKRSHHGMNVKRLREVLQVKQDYLAVQMGLSQQAISHIEQRETIDAPTLEKISAILKVPVEVIKNYDDEKTVMNIQNNFEGSNNQGANVANQYNINPIEKWLEAMEDNKKLVDKNERLYERLLHVEREKNELLQRLLDEKTK